MPMTAAVWSLGHRPGLDGVRGIAILLVLLGHLEVWGVTGGGWAGVTLFFVLSGFLITSILLDEHAATGRISLPKFYRRRALRLLPALGAILAVTLAGRLVSGDQSAWRDAAGVAFYSANWLEIATGTDLPWLGHTWSLAVEEQYYLVWPFLLLGLMAITRLRFRALFGVVITLAVASALWRAALYSGPIDYTRAYVGTDARADALLAGSALAIWFHMRGAARPGPAIVVAGAVLMALVAMPLPGMGPRELIQVGFAATAIGATVLVAFAATTGAALLEARPLRWLGRISYGLYLWHLPVIAVVIGALTFAGLPRVISGPVGLLAAVGAASLSYRFVEEPFLRLKGRSGRLAANAAIQPGSATPAPRSR